MRARSEGRRRHLARGQQREHAFLERRQHRLTVGQFVARQAVVQVVDQGRGGLDTGVGAQQQGFDFLDREGIDAAPAEHQVGDAAAQAFAGAREALTQAGEQARPG